MRLQQLTMFGYDRYFCFEYIRLHCEYEYLRCECEYLRCEYEYLRCEQSNCV